MRLVHRAIWWIGFFSKMVPAVRGQGKQGRNLEENVGDLYKVIGGHRKNYSKPLRDIQISNMA